MSPHNLFVLKNSPMAIEDDLVDDSTDIVPMSGLITPKPLSARFVTRMVKMTAASVELAENKKDKSVTVTVCRNNGSPQMRVETDKDLQEFLQIMECSMITIAKHSSGEIRERAQEELWEAILLYAYPSMDHIVDSIRTCFLDNQDTFGSLVIKMFGILDQNESRSTLDRELGDRIMSLNQGVRDYDKSMKQLHGLIQCASFTTKSTEHLQSRMNGLLRSRKFVNTLFELICTLGYPERAYNTFVRAASSTQSFTNLTIRTKPNVASPGRARSMTPMRSLSTPTTTPHHAKRPFNTISPPFSQSSAKTATSSPSQREVKLAQKPPQPPLESPGLPQPSPRFDRRELLKPEPIQKKDTRTVLRSYLAGEDPQLNQTVARQDAILLLNGVLNQNLLPISTNAWYQFGFVTARNEEEERQIGGLYAAVLKDAPNKASIFDNLVHATETNTLAELFDMHGWGHFGQELPQLELFLKTPPHQRPSVWRLKQFLQSDGEPDPPAVLRRDFGFRYCKMREEVAYLKVAYAQMLAHLGPIKLHHACLYGRLYDTARQRGILVDPKYKRLMENDYPSTCIGFDNDEGLAAYRGKMFKSSR